MLTLTQGGTLGDVPVLDLEVGLAGIKEGLVDVAFVVFVLLSLVKAGNWQLRPPTHFSMTLKSKASTSAGLYSPFRRAPAFLRSIKSLLSRAV